MSSQPHSFLVSVGGAAARMADRLGQRLAAWFQAFRADPDARERASAVAAFAFIFAFGAASLDYVITGGPDWSPGAAAAPLNHPTRIVTQASQAIAYETPPELPEVELVAYEPTGPIPDLLGGPETELPFAAAPELTLASYQPVAPAAISAPASTAPAPARKHKRAGA
jgi:hypothetical protein